MNSGFGDVIGQPVGRKTVPTEASIQSGANKCGMFRARRNS
jgi:hypothetical protein